MLDEIDQKTVSFLQYDGRMSYTKIAVGLGVTEGTVRRRVLHLKESGILQIVAIVEPHIFSWEEAAMIGISVNPNTISNIAEQIASLPEVSYLFQAAGEYDLIAEVFCKDRGHFVSFLNDKLQKTTGVVSTRFFMILKMYKLSYRWDETESPKFD